VIRQVTIERFKRFERVQFSLPGHVVLAGPNNTGKTTILQAIAAWGLALDRFRERNDIQRHGGYYPKVPIARQAFSAVPLRQFDLLWPQRDYKGTATVTIRTDHWTLPMEFHADSTEQIYVRPPAAVEPAMIKAAQLPMAFVPPMTGLTTDEPVYTRARIDYILGQARPGEVLRNLLLEASSGPAWKPLRDSIQRLFGYVLQPPNAVGPSILAEYQPKAGAASLDIASAGSGFQQVLMLLTFLYARPASILLLDEPDAHLHVILQDAIYGELRAVAARQKSQLVMATHSEVVIDAVDPSDLFVVLDQPRPLADSQEKARLIKSLGSLSNEDVVRAIDAPGILYVEDYTDLEILRQWASVLDHAALPVLTTRLFWKRTVVQPRAGAAGISAKEHFEALKLMRTDLPGLQILDGDGNPNAPETAITGQGLQVTRFRRYEIESYLVHPEALARFVAEQTAASPDDARARVQEGLRAIFTDLTPGFLASPLEPPPLVENYLRSTKARTGILPPVLSHAGLPGFPYQQYSEIAALMRPDEIHPEVVEKLDAIVRAFGG
jgi:hypothetical protein